MIYAVTVLPHFALSTCVWNGPICITRTVSIYWRQRLRAADDAAQPVAAGALSCFVYLAGSSAIEHRDDGMTYYNKSRAVDFPFIATLDRSGVGGGQLHAAGRNVWSNPELTCQHVDRKTFGSAAAEHNWIKILVMRSTVEQRSSALSQRASLK